MAQFPAVSPAVADELRDALTMAYSTNPSLQAARANQRATDEAVPLARAQELPSLSGTANYSEFVSSSGISAQANGPNRNLDLGLTFSLPLYAGGAIRNAVHSAQTRVDAGRADLRGVESGVFAQVVASYMDVILAEAVVRLNRSSVKQLEVNLQATRDRFEIGDLTRTDVAQSDSRLALARGQSRTAEANLIAARERYIQIVGKEPDNLQYPAPLAAMPATTEDAVTIALADNPDLLAARQRIKAADYEVRVAGASRLPRISLFATADRTDYLGTLGGVLSHSFTQRGTSAVAGVRATIPLYQGGAPAATRRQAQDRQSVAMEQEIGIERAVIANVRAAYAQWQAATGIIASTQAAVSAAELSLEGVRAENTVGNRTILDILNAEQELLNAQVQLVTAQRNAYVSGFNLLAAMGKAEARDLGLDGAALYDPQVNYARARGTFWDWSSASKSRPVSPRTVDTKPQNGSVTDR